MLGDTVSSRTCTLGTGSVTEAVAYCLLLLQVLVRVGVAAIRLAILGNPEGLKMWLEMAGKASRMQTVVLDAIVSVGERCLEAKCMKGN